MKSSLGTLPPELVGKVVTPDDRRYRMLRSTYTTVGSPAAVVGPESADDVAASECPSRVELAQDPGRQAPARGPAEDPATPVGGLKGGRPRSEHRRAGGDLGFEPAWLSPPAPWTFRPCRTAG